MLLLLYYLLVMCSGYQEVRGLGFRVCLCLCLPIGPVAYRVQGVRGFRSVGSAYHDDA